MIILGTTTTFESEYHYFLPCLREGTKLSPQMTINDIDPTKKKLFIAIWKKKAIEQSLPLLRDMCQKQIHAIDPSISQSDPLLALTEKARNVFDKHMRDIAENWCDVRLKHFFSGKSLATVMNLKNQPVSFRFTDSDFITPPDSNQDFIDRRLNTLLRREKKKNVKLDKNLRKIFDHPNLPVTTAHICQIKWFQELAAMLGKNISELTQNDLINNENKLDLFIKQKDIEKKEKEAKKAENELLALLEQEENKKTSSSSSKKKTKKTVRQGKKTPSSQIQSLPTEEIRSSSSLSPLASKVLSLNSPSFHSLYSFAPRVSRWGEPDLTKTRLFEDLNASNEVVKKYANCTDEQLHFWRAKHNLSCFGKLLSEPELCPKYSFPYAFETPQGRRHKGRSFYCVMEFYNQKYSGLISVAFNEQNIIYHALFEHHKESKLIPAQMLPQIENSQQIPNNEIWQFTTPFQFSLEEDDQIKIVIGKNSASCVTFHIYPLA